jgi:hypothetical protein
LSCTSPAMPCRLGMFFHDLHHHPKHRYTRTDHQKDVAIRMIWKLDAVVILRCQRISELPSASSSSGAQEMFLSCCRHCNLRSQIALVAAAATVGLLSSASLYPPKPPKYGWKFLVGDLNRVAT